MRKFQHHLFLNQIQVNKLQQLGLMRMEIHWNQRNQVLGEPGTIPGYEYVKTVTDPNGNIRHIFKKVEMPTPVEPSQPVQPVSPQEPTSPEKPVTPDMPAVPEQPKQPATPKYVEGQKSCQILVQKTMLALRHLDSRSIERIWSCSSQEEGRLSSNWYDLLRGTNYPENWWIEWFISFFAN